MGLFGRALAALFLDKKARAALKRAGAAPAEGRAQTIARMQEQASGLVTPERAALIRQAMAVRQAKQTILADLNDEQRQKLVAMAMKRLLHEKPEG